MEELAWPNKGGEIRHKTGASTPVESPLEADSVVLPGSCRASSIGCAIIAMLCASITSV